MYQWDATLLIACAKFEVGCRLVLDYALDVAVLDDRIAQYVNRIKAKRHETEAAVVRELVEAGYDEAVRQRHARYQHGELMFRTIAAELGLSVQELYDLFEQKGLPT